MTDATAATWCRFCAEREREREREREIERERSFIRNCSIMGGLIQGLQGLEIRI